MVECGIHFIVWQAHPSAVFLHLQDVIQDLTTAGLMGSALTAGEGISAITSSRIDKFQQARVSVQWLQHYLSSAQQVAVAKLSLFEAPFTAAAAATVLRNSGEGELRQAQAMLRQLQSLGLVQQHPAVLPAEGEQQRFSLQCLVHALARQLLEQQTEQEQLAAVTGFANHVLSMGAELQTLQPSAASHAEAARHWQQEAANYEALARLLHTPAGHTVLEQSVEKNDCCSDAERSPGRPGTSRGCRCNSSR